MTLSDLLALAWRRWLVAVTCLGLTGVALFLVAPPVEAWNARVAVVLLVPRGTPGNPIASTTTSLIATTGVVARHVTGADDTAQTVSSDLNLASTEAEPGWSLRQPSVGGQWDVNYEEPRLDVKSWGRTRAEASAQMDQALAAIDDSLKSLQDERAVDQGQRIRVQLSPSQPVVTVQSGSRLRALAGTALAGLLLTLAAVVGADRLDVRRRARAAQGGADVAVERELTDSNR
jgi:hypothetical protein